MTPRDFLDLVEDLVYAVVSALVWAAVLVPYAFVLVRVAEILSE